MDSEIRYIEPPKMSLEMVEYMRWLEDEVKRMIGMSPDELSEYGRRIAGVRW